MKLLLDYVRSLREYEGFLQHRKQLSSSKYKPVCVTGLSDGAKYAFLASAITDIKRTALIILPDEKDCLKMYNALCSYSVKCAVYPLRDFNLHPVVASHEYEHQRLSVLSGIISHSLDCAIATPDAVMQLTVPPERLKQSTLTLSLGDTCDLESLCSILVNSGYARVQTVDNVGQFSVRGGICDIFTPGSDYPYRMEFFGDEIDSMGIFDIVSQRRVENAESFTVFPVREVNIDSESKKRLHDIITSQKKASKKPESRKILDMELEAIESDSEILYADKYISVIYDDTRCLLDYFTPDDPVFVDNSAAVKQRIDTFEAMNETAVTALMETGEIASKYAIYSLDPSDFEYILNSSFTVYLDLFVRAGGKYSQTFAFNTKNQLSYASSSDFLTDELENLLANKYTVMLLCENEATAKNYAGLLEQKSMITPIYDSETLNIDIKTLVGSCIIVYGCGVPGFTLERARFACISLFVNQSVYSKKGGIRSHKKGKNVSAKEKIMSYADLSVGDYVVHDTHGIGLYKGIKNLTNYEGVTRDFLHIEYAGDSTLYVPCDRLDSLSKYIGAKAEDGTVKLNKMGGTEWGKAKTRVKAAVRQMAKELIALYAKRMNTPGYKYSHDDDLQRSFEAAFEYDETDCQLNAANDIKRDMQSPHPMDRLLCGDVGFGKTEVALRAAFKAVGDGKQVAILVPTTILAMQHYQTVLARMRTFPVSVDILSRFKTPKQQVETLRKLRRGDIDIIIGTHRLISKDVEFNDLGLIIIDEEQRFGVAHKEKLKQISKNADVLTLTATPIPRTLNMAISGIRDMSVLDEPPEDRLPPQTYVIEYDELIIAEAIKKELRRGGQVFYLHNNVDDIDKCAAKISSFVPDAVISVAHGQMDKNELSDTWGSMISGQTDILICTTIIETGVDVPNANTLIIENSDRMGLSQLHQIRGRIGRSSRRSYAYFTYKKDKVLTEIAEKRLNAMREFTEFGSGFKIALRDLEIRGAGNVLGAEQHGHMDSVGYDMYIKLLNEAVLEETGKAEKPKTDCTIELKVSAFIPEDYIKSGSVRIEIYKKISHIQNSEDTDDIADELLDRFGDIPNTVCSLIDISYIRAMGCRLGIKQIRQDGKKIVFYPESNDLRPLVLLTSDSGGRMVITPGISPTATYHIKNGDAPLSYIRQRMEYAVAEYEKSDV